MFGLQCEVVSSAGGRGRGRGWRRIEGETEMERVVLGLVDPLGALVRPLCVTVIQCVALT